MVKFISIIPLKSKITVSPKLSFDIIFFPHFLSYHLSYNTKEKLHTIQICSFVFIFFKLFKAFFLQLSFTGHSFSLSEDEQLQSPLPLIIFIIFLIITVIETATMITTTIFFIIYFASIQSTASRDNSLPL